MRRLPSEPVYLMNKRIQREAYKILKRRAKIAVIEICIIVVTLVILFFSTNPLIENFKYRINGINCEFQSPDFDNGNTILFETGREILLIDSGNKNHGEELLRFLSSEEINSINYLFIPELSEEYFHSLDEIFNSVTVNKIILPSTDNEHLQNIFDDYIASTPVFAQTANEGMSLKIGKSTVDVTDVSSLSVMISFGKNKFLILNRYEVEEEILDFNGDVIIKNKDSFIEIMDDSSERVYRTDMNGDINIKSNEVDIKIKCENQ